MITLGFVASYSDVVVTTGALFTMPVNWQY